MNKKLRFLIFILLTLDSVFLAAQIINRVEVVFSVKDVNGQPIIGAEVSFKINNEIYSYFGVTDTDGKAKQKIKTDERYTFKISAEEKHNKISFETNEQSITRGEAYKFPIVLKDKTSNISGFVYNKDNNNAPISGVTIRVYEKNKLGGKNFVKTTDQEGFFSIDTYFKPTTPILIKIRKGAEFSQKIIDTLSSKQLSFGEGVYLERTNTKTIVMGDVSGFDAEAKVLKGISIPLIISDLKDIESFSSKSDTDGKFKITTSFKRGDTIKISINKNLPYTLSEGNKKAYIINQFDEFEIGNLLLENKKKFITGKTLLNRQPKPSITLLASLKKEKDWIELPKMISNEVGIYRDTKEGFVELPKKVRFKLDEPAKDRISLMKPFIKHEYIFWWKNRYDSEVNLNIRKNKIYNQRKWWITGGLALAGLGFTINKGNKFDKYAKSPKDNTLYNEAKTSRKIANKFFEATFLSIGLNLAIKTQITRTVRLNKNNAKKR